MDTSDSAPPHNQSLSSTIKPVSRRRHSKALKREMVEATLDGKTSVSIIARQYDINANQLFLWRKQYHDGLLGDATQAALLPVKVKAASQSTATMSVDDSAVLSSDGAIEIILSNHYRVVVRGKACQQSLLTILQMLS